MKQVLLSMLQSHHLVALSLETILALSLFTQHLRFILALAPWPDMLKLVSPLYAANLGFM